MPDPTHLETLDEKLHAATRTPEPRPEFLADLRRRVIAQAYMDKAARQPVRRAPFRPTWGFAAAALLILLAAFFAIGPRKVIAAVGGLFGYVPGVGIVDQSAPIRILAEPAAVTRDGITLAVTQAILTADKTSLRFETAGVPASAYPNREDVVGCSKIPYLLLPDGTRLEGLEQFPPFPAMINQATLVVPCLLNTLPGTVPENWELPLRFKVAPPEMTVMPIYTAAPVGAASPLAAGAQPEATSKPSAATAAPAEKQDAVAAVDSVIETHDGYILTGYLRSQAPKASRIVSDGQLEIRDASSKRVAYSVPKDIQLPNSGMGDDGPFPWAYEIQASGITFPITFSFPGKRVYEADPQATAEFEFDAGADPQPGQEWKPNQKIQLAGHTLRLVSVAIDSRNGYAFRFAADPQVEAASIAIAGTTPNGGGGGGNGPGEFNVSIGYTDLPKGKLKVILSHLTVYGPQQVWRVQWQPATARAWPTPTPAPATLCLTADSLDTLPSLPGDLTGRVILHGKFADGQAWGLSQMDLDGSPKQELVPNGSWGALSPDGSRLAYPGENGIAIRDLTSGAVNTLKTLSAYNLRWSPDGTQIAFEHVENGTSANGVYVVAADGSGQPHRLTDQGYEEVAGWSGDGNLVYYTAQDIGGWKLHQVNVNTGEDEGLFVLGDTSVKGSEAVVSPDGKWVAYNDQEASVHLVRPDGTQDHLIAQKLSTIGMSHATWSQDGRWLAVVVMTSYNDDQITVLMQPEGCWAYLAPALHGELEALYLP